MVCLHQLRDYKSASPLVQGLQSSYTSRTTDIVRIINLSNLAYDIKLEISWSYIVGVIVGDIIWRNYLLLMSQEERDITNNIESVKGCFLEICF